MDPITSNGVIPPDEMPSEAAYLSIIVKNCPGSWLFRLVAALRRMNPIGRSARRSRR